MQNIMLLVKDYFLQHNDNICLEYCQEKPPLEFTTPDQTAVRPVFGSTRLRRQSHEPEKLLQPLIKSLTGVGNSSQLKVKNIAVKAPCIKQIKF